MKRIVDYIKKVLGTDKFNPKSCFDLGSSYEHVIPNVVYASPGIDGYSEVLMVRRFNKPSLKTILDYVTPSLDAMIQGDFKPVSKIDYFLLELTPRYLAALQMGDVSNSDLVVPQMADPNNIWLYLRKGLLSSEIPRVLMDRDLGGLSTLMDEHLPPGVVEYYKSMGLGLTDSCDLFLSFGKESLKWQTELRLEGGKMLSVERIKEVCTSPSGKLNLDFLYTLLQVDHGFTSVENPLDYILDDTEGFVDILSTDYLEKLFLKSLASEMQQKQLAKRLEEVPGFDFASIEKN